MNKVNVYVVTYPGGDFLKATLKMLLNGLPEEKAAEPKKEYQLIIGEFTDGVRVCDHVLTDSATWVRVPVGGGKIPGEALKAYQTMKLPGPQLLEVLNSRYKWQTPVERLIGGEPQRTERDGKQM